MADPQCVLILAAFASLLWGCNADAPTPPALVAADGYHQPTSPDSVVANLILAHNKRDRAQYAALLAPEFKFYFTSTNVNDFGVTTWSKIQDSTGTATLFHDVSDIDLTAISTAPVDADPNFFPPGTEEIHLRSVEMTVLQPNRVFYVVRTEQDLYLRPGNAGSGEDPTHWFLSEWHEVEPITAPSTDDPTPARGATWGQMKYQYLFPPGSSTAARP